MRPGFISLTVKGNPFTGGPRKSFHGPRKEILFRTEQGNPFTSLYPLSRYPLNLYPLSRGKAVGVVGSAQKTARHAGPANLPKIFVERQGQ
jgi:hypothetical protein